MKIRFEFALALAIGLGAAGCASGGGGTGGGGATDEIGGAGGGLIGENPRETENTRAAAEHLELAGGAADDATAQMHYEQALASAEAAVAEDPRNPLAHRQAALANLGLENYEAAAEAFDTAAELRPLYEFEDQGVRERVWIDLYQQAAPLVQQGDYEGAAAIFEDANTIYSDRPEAMITLGQIYAQMRDHDRALENLDQALAIIDSASVEELDSATVASWQEQREELPLLRAQILADAGRFEEAVTAFRGIAADDPEDVGARRALAGLLLQSGDTAGAFEVYDSLLARPELAHEDYYNIGIGFYQGDAYERAAEAFGQAAEELPQDRDALEMWARSLQLDSAFAEVPPVADRWIELDPYSQNAYLILAQAVNQLGDQTRAREAIQRIDELQVQVTDLQISRFDGGGAEVSGSVSNKTLEPGTAVTLEFTFYGESGSPMGTATANVSVGGEGMSEIFRVEFDSAQPVGGYGYDLTVG